MKRQKNTTQMKEKTRNTEVQINEKEIGKLPEKEFRIMIIKIIKNLENKMEKMQELNKLLGTRFLEYRSKHTNQDNRVYTNDADFRHKILILPEHVCTHYFIFYVSQRI